MNEAKHERTAPADFILMGSAYALQQSGLLLKDAATLFASCSDASAVALAAFAREELGRCRLLFELYERAKRGELVTFSEIEKCCGDHVTKQKRSLLGMTMRLQGVASQEVGAIATEHPHSARYKVARRILDAALARLRKRAPNKLHVARLRALYVEPDECGWWRPNEGISREFAADFLTDAANDYATHLRGNDESRFNLATRALPGCPAFPEPSWPRAG